MYVVHSNIFPANYHPQTFHPPNGKDRYIMYRYTSHVVGQMAIYNIRQPGGIGARNSNATTLVETGDGRTNRRRL